LPDGSNGTAAISFRPCPLPGCVPMITKN